MIVHLYKLISGETIIAEFIEQQVVNSQTNARIHLLKRPYIVSNEWTWDELEFPWINGLADADVDIPLPMNAILLVVEEAGIDPVLVESYRALVE